MLGGSGDFDTSSKAAAIQASFDMSLLLFLPLVVVVVLALLKLPPFTTIFTGALVAGVLAAIMSPERVATFAQVVGRDELPMWLACIKGVWLALASGYVSTTGYPELDQLLSRGGMSSMMDTVWLIVTALAFGGVVEKAGVLDKLITPIIQRIKSPGGLITSMVGTVFATNVVTADQYIAIVLPGRMFKTTFAQRGFAPVVLSRTVGAAATPTSALVPWNSCGAYMAATLGVTTASYAPYALFSLLSPVLVIAVALVGLRIQRNPDTSVQPPEDS
ncbi:Na(+)/H(+) antiporter NhaC [compost metagenome]